MRAHLKLDPQKITAPTTQTLPYRNLELSDDMKEYWGFYLLRGSTVTVSTCARYV